NRFLTEAPWDAEALNEARIDWHQKDPSTRFSERGVIAIDNALIDHYGQKIEDAGYFWDHVEVRYKIALDYVFANYVCTTGKHYPLYLRRFKKEVQCQEDDEEFINHTELTIELVDQVCEREIPGTFTWDSFFTNARTMNHVHGKKDAQGHRRAYVGDLNWKGVEQKISEVAASIPIEDRKEIRRGDKRQWYFTATLKIPKVNHKVRVVILWDQRRDKEPRKILITNRTNWEVQRILWVYRDRWTGTETYHRDGKQELGMGDCQLRDGQGQTRHMYLVMMAYSLLTSQLKQARARDWALCKLTTIGEASRAMLRESLRQTLAWAVDQIVNRSRKHKEVLMQLGLA
ncbi:MAG: IS701 family transposase, partial [Chthonomonadales bacterium]|nr:IS701 family transposase [Chthonomonadales bacterium]